MFTARAVKERVADIMHSVSTGKIITIDDVDNVITWSVRTTLISIHIWLFQVHENAVGIIENTVAICIGKRFFADCVCDDGDSHVITRATSFWSFYSFPGDLA